MHPKTTVTSCFAPGCKSSSDKQHGIQFYCFPHDSALARLWNVQLGSDKTPKKSSRVCEKHFCPDDYTESGAKDDRQVLKKEAIPSRNIIKKSINPLVKLPEQDIQATSSSLHPKQNSTIGKNDATTQTDKQLVGASETQTDSEPIPTETILYNELSSDDFYFFTGLVLPNFKELTDYLDIDSKPNKYTIILSNCDQLILTLINLRRRIEMKVVAKMYGIHPNIVCDIFLLWINLMSEQFRKTDLWALRENGELGYTAILHCCEIPCELNNPGLQSILKTRKKKRLSIKYFVATDEQGMVIFCSNQLFSGSIPDQQAITQSGILAKLTKGDKVLTECDFSSNEIIFHRPDECSDVDKGREYIKRLALMTKKFGILKGVFPANLMPNAAVIIYVTNVLVNFISEETTD